MKLKLQRVVVLAALCSSLVILASSATMSVPPESEEMDLAFGYHADPDGFVLKREMDLAFGYHADPDGFVLKREMDLAIDGSLKSEEEVC